MFFAFLIGARTYAASAQNPPSHAKAHGVKKKYRYYPQSNVYFDPDPKKYTYLAGGRWITGVTLPNTIRLTGSFNDFDFHGDDPWKDNKNHKEKYKPIKSNNIKKWKNNWINMIQILTKGTEKEQALIFKPTYLY